MQEIVDGDGAVQKVDAAAAMTVGDVFKEWVVKHLSTLSEGYGESFCTRLRRGAPRFACPRLRLGFRARRPARFGECEGQAAQRPAGREGQFSL